MQYPKGRKEDIQRILTGATRCLNCDKPLKYAKYEVQAYCCRACLCAYTPTMVYFRRKMFESLITVAILGFIIGACMMLIYILLAIGPEKTNQLSKWLRRKG